MVVDFTRTRHTTEQHNPLRLQRDVRHDRRQVQSFERENLGGNVSCRDGERAASLEEVDTEAVLRVVVVREVDRTKLVEVLHLLVGQDVLRNLEEFDRCDRLNIHRLERTTHTDLWFLLRLHNEIRSAELDSRFQKVTPSRRVRIMVLSQQSDLRSTCPAVAVLAGVSVTLIVIASS